MPRMPLAYALPILLLPSLAEGQVQVDLTSAFTGDYVRNTGDTADDAIGGIDLILVTSSVADKAVGLPNDGVFLSTTDHPRIEIAAIDKNAGANAVVLARGESATIRPPTEQYARLQVYAFATGGRASTRVRITYGDGTSSDTTVNIPDWLEDPPPAGFFYLIDGMDRYSRGNDRLEGSSDAAVFGFDVDVDRAKVVSTVGLENTSGGAQQSVVVGMTGERIGALAQDDLYIADEDEPAVTNAAAGLLANDRILNGGVAEARLKQGPRSGRLALNVDGSFTYTSNPDFNGMDEFSYTVASTNGDQDDGQVRIIVRPTNDPPVARPDSFGLVAPGQPVQLELLRNDDLGPDTGETLALVSVSAGTAGGQITIASDSAVEYTSAAAFTGEERFDYVVGDGTPGSTAEATVTVRVGLPMGQPDRFTVNEDTPLTVSAGMGVLANDVAGDGSRLTAQLAVQPSDGMVAMNTTGAFVYTPNQDFFGTDRFTYQAVNNLGSESGPVEVTIEVLPVNDPPTAVNDVLTAQAGLQTTVDVLVNDEIAPDEGETLRIVSVGAPSAGGRAEVSTDGRGVIYTPAADYEGREFFSYSIDDGVPDSRATAIVTATVTIASQPDLGVETDLGPADGGAGTPDAGVPDAGPPPQLADGCRGTAPSGGGLPILLLGGLYLWRRRSAPRGR